MSLQDRGFTEADWAKLRRVTEHTPDVTMVLDTECTIQFINWTTPGLSIEEVLGTAVYEYVPAEQHTAMQQCFRAVQTTGQPGAYANVYDTPNGTKLEWESHVAPITDGDEVIGFTVFSRDVTERNASDRERTRFFDLSVDMLCVTADGYFRRVSPSFTRVLGFSEEELLSRPFMEMIHPDDRPHSEDVLRGLSSGKEIIDFESRIQCRDGGYKLVSWRSRADTATGQIYAVGRDITNQRTLESQVREAQKMDAIGQLAGGIAHDFNNLMLSVLVNAEFAAETVTDESELAEFLNEITRAGQRATTLTKQLLAFSRSENLQTIELDMNQLTEGMLQMLRRLLPESIELDFIPGNRLPRVRADKNQIEQVLLNLCVNARDAMPGGGRLTIETETVLVNGRFRESYPWAKPGRYVLLSVTDTGCGMPKDVTERIFEPFFTTKPTGKGTGLGLATAYAILKQHDGLVHVYSEPDVGSTFKVYLPAAAQMATAVGNKADPGLPGGRETILVAEDEDLVRGIVVRILERAGYRVLTARNGREAVRLLQENVDDVDVALLDVVMPELSGPDAHRLLLEVKPGLPVIFSSGYADEARFSEMPSDSVVLEKPYRSEDLLGRVREVIAKSRGETPNES